MPTLATLEERNVKTLLAMEKKYEAQVAGVLRDALTDMRSQMTVIYDKYAVNGELTLAQMTQYNRLAKMEKQVLETMNEATRKSVGKIAKLRPAMYDEAFFRYAWAVDQSTGVALEWGQLNTRQIVESLDNRMYKLAIKSYSQDARVRILRAVNNGLALGKSYSKMARELKDGMNATLYQATRIIRTEGQTAQSAAQDAAYTKASDQGVDLDVYWDASLDGRTRESHASMDGAKRNPETGVFTLPNGEKPPYPSWQNLSAGERIHCRCRIRGQIEGFDPALRRTREDGVIPYQTYDKWKGGLNARGKNVAKAIPRKGGFIPARSIEEARQWAIDNDLADDILYGKLPLDMVNEINQSVYEMYQSYPEIRGRMGVLGSNQAVRRKYIAERTDDILNQYKDMFARNNMTAEAARKYAKKQAVREIGRTPPRNYAMAYKSDKLNGITFNENQAKNITASLKRDVANKFHPVGCDTVKSVTDHELGHKLDEIMGWPSAEIDWINTAEARKDITDGLSEYARINNQEYLAEGLSEYINNPSPREHARRVGEFVNRRYAEWRK